MQIIISTRGTELAEGLRQHVEEQFERLRKFEPRVSRVEVTLSEEKQRRIAEASLSGTRGLRIHGRAEAADFRSAVDRLSDKLSTQLKKRRSRRKNRRATARTIALSDEGEV